MPEIPVKPIVEQPQNKKTRIKDKIVSKFRKKADQNPRDVFEEAMSASLEAEKQSGNLVEEFKEEIVDVQAGNESEVGVKEGFLRLNQQIQHKSERMRAISGRVQELNEVKPDGNISPPEQIMQSIDDWKETPLGTPLENLNQSVQVLQNLKAITQAGWEESSRLREEEYNLQDEQRRIELEMARLKSGIGGKVGLLKRRGFEKRTAAIQDRVDEIAKLKEERGKVRYDLDTKKYTAEGLQQKFIKEEAAGVILSLSQEARAYLDNLLQDEQFLESVRLATGADTKKHDVDEVFAGLIAYDVSQKIKKEMLDHITTERGRWDMGYFIGDNIRDHLPTDKEDQYGFYKKLSDAFRYNNSDLPFPGGDLPVWRSILASPQAREVFGDVLDRADDNFFKDVYRGAHQASDHYGNGVGLLSYFPRPESFGLALQLATLQGSRDYAYHSESARHVIRSFAENTDLMKTLEENSPELKGAEEFLEQWGKGTGYNSFSEKMRALRKFSDPYLLAEYRKNPNTFIIHSMGEGALAQVGFDKGMLSKEEALGIEYAVTVDQSDEQVLSTEIRSLLFPTLSEEGSDLPPQDAAVLKKRAEVLVRFKDRCGWAKDEKYSQVVSFVFNNRETFLGGPEDVSFINTIVSASGPRSKELLAGYKECIDGGVLEPSERGIFLDLVKQFKIASPDVVKLYKQAREGGYDNVFISDLRSVAEKLTGKAKLTDEERAKPFFNSLIRHVYPNNAGEGWTNYEDSGSCQDRSTDLEQFRIDPEYRIDLLSQTQVRLKSGEVLDPDTLVKLQEPVYAFGKRLQEAGGDIEKMKGSLADNIQKTFGDLVEKGIFDGLDSTNFTLDQKMFLVLTESLYGKNGIDSKTAKEMMISYEFTNFEDISNYINGTTDRVSYASNKDYALLCELSQFYSDRIKEVNKKLVESGFANPEIAGYMKRYFDSLSQSEQEQERKDKINKHQFGKLGMSPGFVAEMGKILEGRYGRKLTSDEVTNIISRYESVAGGLTERSSTSEDKNTRAVYGKLRSQREKTFEAMKLIAGTDIDPRSIHLGEINLQEALDTEEQIREGIYSPDQFAAYTAQRFVDIFDDERGEIDLNLTKFESESGKNREVLNAYFTKTPESAYARMVGGVCVSGDNPSKGELNMWDMPNYFQLVLQDPETLQCQGLVLLHHFVEKGNKVLSASLNPSSTYLYSVDEQALFSGLMGVLESFGQANNFDAIVLSKNEAIRTNRTGGVFESAIKKRISSVNQEFSFTEDQQFSYRPNYGLQNMDTVWQRPA